MSNVATLSLEFVTQTSALDRGFSDVLSKTESLARDMGGISMPSLGPDVSGLGDQIGTALAQGLAPLNGFASRFEKSFDRVGGTITTLARRIDSSMKFSAATKAIETVQGKIRTGFASASAKAAEDLGAIDKAVLRWGPSIDKGLTVINKVRTALDYLSTRGDVAAKGLGKLGMAPVSGGVITSYAKLTANITGIGPAAQVASRGVKALGGQIALSLGIVSGFSAVFSFFAKGIKGASDLGETVSKVGTVFGDATASVQGNADQMAKAFGLPKKEILDASASIGLVGKAAGQSEKDAAGMSVSMAKLAADASSFYNVPLDDALGKIRSGLVGEAEPLRAFGVLLSEDAVKQEAMRLGLTKTGKDLTENAKVTARASLITRGLSDASGDLARTQGSTANQFRKLTGGVSNLATTIGASMLPAVDTVIGGLTGFTSKVGSFVESNKAAFDAVGQYLTGAIQTYGEGLGNLVSGLTEIGSEIVATLGFTSQGVGSFGESVLGVFGQVGMLWRNIGSIFQLVWIDLKQGALNVGETLGVIPANLQQIGNYLANNWRKLIVDAVTSVGTVFSNLGKNIWELGKSVVNFLKDPSKGFKYNWTPMLDGFKATADKLPEIIKPQLTSLQGEIDAVTKKIGENELAHAEKVAKKAQAIVSTPLTAPKAALGETKKLGESKSIDKFASASDLQFGSKEVLASLAVSQRASRVDPSLEVQKQGLAEAKKQTAILQTIAQNKRRTDQVVTL